MATKTAYRYCILPGSNAPEFSQLDAELKARGVRAEYSVTCGGGRVYRIHWQDRARLPRDEKGPYLGDDDSGHSLSVMHPRYMQDFIEEVRESPWLSVW